jgi:hypothetical protein
MTRICEEVFWGQICEGGPQPPAALGTEPGTSRHSHHGLEWPELTVARDEVQRGGAERVMFKVISEMEPSCPDPALRGQCLTFSAFLGSTYSCPMKLKPLKQIGTPGRVQSCGQQWPFVPH